MTENQQIAAVILAAGKGTRMKSAMPKVMHKIAGTPMLGHVLETVQGVGVSKVVAVIGPAMDKMREYVVGQSPNSDVVVQETQNGTGDAVKYALPALEDFSGLVMVLYGDTPFIREDTLEKLAATMDNSDVAVSVLGFRPDDPAEYGRLVVAADGSLEAIVEYKEANDEQRAINFCNSGVVVIRSELLDELLGAIESNNAKGEYYLTDIVHISRSRGYICQVAEAAEDEVMGINSRSQLAEGEAVYQNQLRMNAMNNGVSMVAPETVFISKDTKFGTDIVIHPNVHIGKGVTICDNVEIKSFSHIEEAWIAESAVVGPFARLRPGAKIGEGARIGNFVEIKKSDIQKGAKIGHLTYIGDSIIGEDVNIGAGTVTCNYDGYNKYQTEIGAGAFIGSNSSLIAPVTVGEGAIIGAGSTIRDNVEANAVAHDGKSQIVKKGQAASFRNQKAEEKRTGSS